MYKPKLKQVALVFVLALTGLIFLTIIGDENSENSASETVEGGQRSPTNSIATDLKQSVSPSDLAKANTTTPGRIDPTLLSAEPANASIEGIAYLALVIMAITTAIAVLISFYMYRWRRALINNEHVVVPEKWAAHLDGVGRGLEDLAKQMSGVLSQTVEETRTVSNRVDNMTGTYMELQGALDERETEIKRLKEGYDYQVFKSFIGRFAQIEQTIEEFLEDNPGNEELVFLQRLFGNAFDECRVSRFTPELEQDYRSAIGVADSPKAAPTDDEDKDFQISRVDQPGYQLETGEGQKVIIPAKVTIFKYTNA